jgi:hypothetical protein
MANVIMDGDWQLMEHDATLGRSIWVRDNGDGTMTGRVDYDVTKALDENTAFRNMATPGWSGDWHRVASIPLGVLYNEQMGLIDAAREGDQKYLSRFLNDSDNRAFRTKEGKV